MEQINTTSDLQFDLDFEVDPNRSSIKKDEAHESLNFDLNNPPKHSNYKKSRNNCFALMIKSPEVDKIREKFDKMSQVWPAHIRMIYPFPVEKHFPHFIRLIQAAIDQLDMKQFQMTLERVDAFMQKTNHSIVIRPDKKSSQKIVDLYKLVMPHIDTNIKRRYNPRILCGKIHRERIMNAAPKKQRKKIRKMNMKHQRKQITDVMQKLNEDWEPVQVTIDSFQLLQLNEVSGEVETIHEFKLE